MDNTNINAAVGAQPTAGSTPPPQSLPGSRREWHVGRWLARFVLALCFLTGFYLSVFPMGRATVRSLAILPGLLSAAQPPWEAPVAEPIQHTQTTIPSSAGTVSLDIYAPVGSVPPVPGTREGVLVIPGVGDQRKDAQLVNFSETLAHAGMVVMDMTTQALLNLRLDAGDTQAVIQAFHALQHWPGVSARRSGMFGISGAGALMCFAAADPSIRGQVAFLALFGSYFDTTTLLEAIGRRAVDVDGKLQPWNPVYFPMQVLADTIAPLLPGSDGQVLENTFAPNGGGKLTADQVAQLDPSSAAVYHLLAGDEPGQVAANLAALSPPVKTLLIALSPARVVDQIRAPIYLLHDRSDQYVPVTESQEFAAALASIHHPYDFAEFGIFQHTEVRANLDLGQILGDGRNLLRLISDVAQSGS